MDDYKFFFTKHKYIIYGYIVWILIHLSFLILGRNERGFFPFGDDFFDVSDYGFFEFFIYVIALPIIAYMVIDLYRNNCTAKKIIKWIGIVLLFLFDITMMFILIHGVVSGIGSIFDHDILYRINHNYALSEILFDFSGTGESICTIISIILTAFMGLACLGSYFEKEPEMLYYSGVFALMLGLTNWFFTWLTDRHWAFSIALIALIIVGIIISNKSDDENSENK